MIRLIEAENDYVIELNEDMSIIDNICESFTEDELNMLSVDGNYTHGWDRSVVVSFVLYVGNDPASFCDVWRTNDKLFSLACGTKPEYRGNGYAKLVCEQAIDWCFENKDDIVENIDWLVNKKNSKSIELAKELGFEYLGTSTTDKDWEFYTMEL